MIKNTCRRRRQQGAETCPGYARCGNNHHSALAAGAAVTPARQGIECQNTVFFLAFWMLKGVEIELLYAGQAFIFGETPKPTTVLAKTVVDQFIYLSLWGAPTMVLAYLWLDKNIDWRRTLSSVDAGWYKKLVLPAMAVNRIIWIPAVTIIYFLPLPFNSLCKISSC